MKLKSTYKKTMKHLIVALAVLGCFAMGNIQAQQQSVASPAGSSYVGSLGYISYTIGEPVIGAVPLNSGTLIQGFENPRSQYKAFNDAVENDHIHFSGVVMDNGNYMKWTIGQTIANVEYELLRSIDGVNFETVTVFNDIGNVPNNILSFTYLDKTAPSGLSYYMLNRVDVDGDQEKSELLTLFRETYSLTDNYEFQVFPNPVVDVMNIHLEKGEAGIVNINVIEVSSRLLENINIDLSAGQNKIDLSNLRSGVYILSIYDAAGNLIGLKRVRKAD